MSKGKRWQKVELNYLKKHADDKNLDELAERFATDVQTVRAKLDELRRASQGSQESHDAVTAAYGKGVEALHEGRWSAAIAAFDVVLGDPDSPELYSRARSFRGLAEERSGAAPPPPADPYLGAVLAKNHGDLDAARATCLADGRHQSDERFAYLLAVVELLRGEAVEAARALARAIELEPRNRWRASQDRDLTSLRRGHPELFG